MKGRDFSPEHRIDCTAFAGFSGIDPLHVSSRVNNYRSPDLLNIYRVYGLTVDNIHLHIGYARMELINPAPSVKPRAAAITRVGPTHPEGEGEREPIDTVEIFEHVRDIVDPEHPQYTLEQLSVVDTEHINVDDARGRVSLQFTPTVEHCSMATLIGLCLRCKLEQSLPTRFKVDVTLKPGSHSTELAVNKQLNDKERVAAALENAGLKAMITKCLNGKGA